MTPYAAAGLAGSLTLAVLAWLRSTATSRNAYADGYGMTAATHRRYAIAGALFAVVFGVLATAGRGSLAAFALAPFVVVALLYAASFVRGFSETEDG